MRRAVWIFCVLACLLALAACGGGGDGEPYGAEDVRAMVDAGAFSEELDPLDADTAFALYHLEEYGVKREELTGCDVLLSSGATCETAAALQFTLEGGSSKDRLDQIKQALENYVQGEITANVAYRPNEIPKLEEAWIEQRGDSFLLVVANDLSAAKKAVK